MGKLKENEKAESNSVHKTRARSKEEGQKKEKERKKEEKDDPTYAPKGKQN